MIPEKLVETLFHKYWAVLIPVILVPLLAVALTYEPAVFRSHALVWVSDPVAGESIALGHANAYATPAQNQAQVIGDLLKTEAFRVAVVRDAGLVADDASEQEARARAAQMNVYAWTQGVNLVAIVAESPSAADAQAIVTAVVSQYLNRATAEFERDADLATKYFSEQLNLATAELNARNTALSEYLVANPEASDPTSPANLSIDYRTLVERVDSQTLLVGELQESLQSVQLRLASAPETQEAAFNVQDPANLAEASIPQSRTKRLGVPFAAAVFGSLIGFAYIYISYRTDHTVRGASELATLNVPLLGTVPELRAGPDWLVRTPLRIAWGWRRRDFARKTAAAISGLQPAAKRKQRSEA